MVQSLYDVLGADAAASAEQLKEAYKQALLASHPDKQQSDASLFHRVQLAWQVLGDSKRRIIYDAQQRSATVDRAIIDDEITMLEMSPVPDSDEDYLEYQCRCGDMYVVGLDELLASCEVLVQCRSCSNHVLVRAKE